MNEKKKNRRKFLRRSIKAIIVTPALAASQTRRKSADVEDEILPGDPGTRDTVAYGSISEE